MTPEDAARRRDAKRFNERLKPFAAFLNTFGIAVFVAAFLAPVVNGRNSSFTAPFVGGLIPIVLHLFAQGILSIWRSED